MKEYTYKERREHSLLTSSTLSLKVDKDEKNVKATEDSLETLTKEGEALLKVEAREERLSVSNFMNEIQE